MIASGLFLKSKVGDYVKIPITTTKGSREQLMPTDISVEHIKLYLQNVKLQLMKNNTWMITVCWVQCYKQKAVPTAKNSFQKLMGIKKRLWEGKSAYGKEKALVGMKKRLRD